MEDANNEILDLKNKLCLSEKNKYITIEIEEERRSNIENIKKLNLKVTINYFIIKI